MDWIYFFLLLAMLVVGLGLIIVNLPGLWLMATGAGLYALVTKGQYIGWGKLAVVLGLCLFAELLELLARAGGAKQAGGSKRSMLLATVGGVAGGLLLSLPVPILGTIAGVCIGAFAGGMLGQMTVNDSKKGSLGNSALVGYGAAKGTLVGMVLKLCVGVVLLLFTAVVALPFSKSTANVPPVMTTTTPTTLPTTSPAP